MRKKIVAGNWKMHKTLEEAQILASEVMGIVIDEVNGNVQIVLCVPFPYLLTIKNQVGNAHSIFVGAQNASDQEWGAYTGEVSSPMLKSAGIPFVILGHSERRQFFNEGGKLLAAKVDKAMANGLTPIFCCGEPLEIREKGTHESLVKLQVTESLFQLSAENLKKVVIAYEPVWAIGTGKTASSQQAQEMHKMIRTHIAGQYGPSVADGISILYGGSVKSDNAKELFACPDFDAELFVVQSLNTRESPQ